MGIRDNYILELFIMAVSCIAVFYYSRKLSVVSNDRDRLLSTVRAIQSDLSSKEGEVKSMHQKIKELFSQRFKLLNDLTASYYECMGSGQEQKRIYNKVIDEITTFSSDTTLRELESILDKYTDNLFSDFRNDFPKLPKSQYRLALYIFCGFSTNVISVFIGKELQNTYVYKSRLKSVIAQKEDSVSSKYLSYF